MSFINPVQIETEDLVRQGRLTEQRAVRCCGTCRHWGREQDPPFCLWPVPDLPFWAQLDNGDHGDYTEADDGRSCRTWEARNE